MIAAPEWITIDAIASKYDVTHETVRLWITRGTAGFRLPAQFIGGKWKTTWEDVECFQDKVTNARLCPVLPTEPINTNFAAEQEAIRKRLNS